jgi:hypothetical protein
MVPRKTLVITFFCFYSIERCDTSCLLTDNYPHITLYVKQWTANLFPTLNINISIVAAEETGTKYI